MVFTILIEQHLSHRLGRREPDFRLAGRAFPSSGCYSQCSCLHLFVGSYANLNCPNFLPPILELQNSPVPKIRIKAPAPLKTYGLTTAGRGVWSLVILRLWSGPEPTKIACALSMLAIRMFLQSCRVNEYSIPCGRSGVLATASTPAADSLPWGSFLSRVSVDDAKTKASGILRTRLTLFGSCTSSRPQLTLRGRYGVQPVH